MNSSVFRDAETQWESLGPEKLRAQPLFLAVLLLR